MEASGSLVVAALSPGSIPNPPDGAGWSWHVCVVVIRTPVIHNSNSAEFRASVILNHSCCGVRIELALGSLPNPRQFGTPIVW